MRQYARLLRRRDFALLWGGATVSALGDGMSFVALVWLLIQRGGTAIEVGWLSAIYTAPVVIGGLVAGVILDRFDPRRVIAADNAIRGLAMTSVPLAAALGVLTTAQLFVVAGTYGLLFMTSAAGIPSVITRVVPEEDLTTANAMESLAFTLSGLVGPGLAGLIIAALAAPVVLAIDGLTYLVFVACLLSMRPMARPVAAGEPAASQAPATSASPSDDVRPAASGGLGPAIRFVLRTPAIVSITAFYMSVNVAGGIFSVVTPLYVHDVLHAGSATFGLLLSSVTLGSLVGILAVGAVRWRWPLGRSIAWSLLASGLVILLWLLRPAVPVLVLVLLAWGTLGAALTPWAQTIRMRLIPAEMRGRVFALLRTSMRSTQPLGSIAGGVLIARGDLTIAIIAIGLLFAVPGAIGIWLPALGPGPTAEPGSGAGTAVGIVPTA